MRYPAVAGQFYEADPDALRAQVEGCYTHRIGPGKVPRREKGPRKIRGLLCPHAGLMYSGPVAAHSYAALAADGWPDHIVLFGPNHTGNGAPVALATSDFQTPLGVARIDQALAAKVTGRGPIEPDLVAHRREHSLEVQLPFLLHLNPEATFLPICLGLQEYDVAMEVGRIVGEALQGKDALVIASTDFSHYIPPEEAARQDRLVLDPILRLDAKAFYRAKTQHDVSMCGYGPVMAMMAAVGSGSATLLKYATSGDVSPMREVVGYAAVVVR